MPNIRLKIRHVEPHKELNVRLRQHVGLIAKGAKRYEAKYVGILRLLTGEGDIVFDVGANIGFYTVLFSCWVGASGKVLAFEPDPNNLQLLNKNVSDNACRNVIIRECALSDATGTGTFSLDRVAGSTGYLGRGPTYGETIFGNGKEFLVDVETSTLDREAGLWEPPSLIKMDIEGGEFDVLRGSTSVLREHRPLVISELSAWSNDVANATRKSELAIQLLGDNGYSLWDLDAGSCLRNGEAAWMILAVPQERVGELRIAKVVRQLECAA